jgi:hypothetical protein
MLKDPSGNRVFLLIAHGLRLIAGRPQLKVLNYDTKTLTNGPKISALGIENGAHGTWHKSQFSTEGRDNFARDPDNVLGLRKLQLKFHHVSPHP